MWSILYISWDLNVSFSIGQGINCVYMIVHMYTMCLSLNVSYSNATKSAALHCYFVTIERFLGENVLQLQSIVLRPEFTLEYMYIGSLVQLYAQFPCVGNVIGGFLSLWIRVQAECCNCPQAKQSRITVCLVSTMSSRYPVFMTDNALQ